MKVDATYINESLSRGLHKRMSREATNELVAAVKSQKANPRSLNSQRTGPWLRQHVAAHKAASGDLLIGVRQTKRWAEVASWVFEEDSGELFLVVFRFDGKTREATARPGMGRISAHAVRRHIERTGHMDTGLLMEDIGLPAGACFLDLFEKRQLDGMPAKAKLATTNGLMFVVAGCGEAVVNTWIPVDQLSDTKRAEWREVLAAGKEVQ